MVELLLLFTWCVLWIWISWYDAFRMVCGWGFGVCVCDLLIAFYGVVIFTSDSCFYIFYYFGMVLGGVFGDVYGGLGGYLWFCDLVVANS